MSRLFLRLMLVAGIGMVGAACQDDGYAAPRGYYQPAPTGYGNPYYNTGYYDDPGFYGDTAVVAAVPADVGGGDAVAYCMQTYRSYDVRSGTYMGLDGYRHPCP